MKHVERKLLLLILLGAQVGRCLEAKNCIVLNINFLKPEMLEKM